MFTANPTNGRRDETVVSAAWGLGESVVSGAVTTDDVVVDPAARRVLSRTTADKAVITVTTADGTREEVPSPAARRRAAVLDDAAASSSPASARAIARALRCAAGHRVGPGGRRVRDRPVPPDHRAARAGGGRRPPSGRSPDPDTALYVRASIVEQLPDPLTPLFAELVTRR